MHRLALATDYDGTLAEDGNVRREVIDALCRFKGSGRRIILVTGRELDDLKRVFPELDVFDQVVAENGALLYTPGRGDGAAPVECALAPNPPAAFAAALLARGVSPISCGRVIVATWEPHQETVLEVIREQQLELEVIFNKGAVMVLPSGVNKASGLARALHELGVAASGVVGVGDAENDHSLLRACGVGAAVANAVRSLKDEADVVTRGARGDGVIELIDRILATDLAELTQTRSAGQVGAADAAPSR